MNGNAPDFTDKSTLPPENLIAFAKKAIKELGLTDSDVLLYLQGNKRVCADCGCRHLYIDRFCPDCGDLQI